MTKKKNIHNARADAVKAVNTALGVTAGSVIGSVPGLVTVSGVIGLAAVSISLPVLVVGSAVGAVTGGIICGIKKSDQEMKGRHVGSAKSVAMRAARFKKTRK